MKATETVELAALVATHGPLLITQSSRLSQAGLTRYWSASKCRTDRWVRALRDYQRAEAEPNSNSLSAWPEISPVLFEVFTSEMLTRVWTSVVTAYDRRRGTEEAEPIVRSTLVGHRDAHNRSLQVLVQRSSDRADYPALRESRRIGELKQTLRRAERWTDLLIGYLLPKFNVAEFAFDADRARDFSVDIQRYHRQGVGQQAWSLTMAALRAAFLNESAPGCPSADLNADIADSILACFEPELFDSIGSFRSLWMTRLLNNTSDAEGMVEDLLKLDHQPAVPRNRISGD